MAGPTNIPAHPYSAGLQQLFAVGFTAKPAYPKRPAGQGKNAFCHAGQTKSTLYATQVRQSLPYTPRRADQASLPYMPRRADQASLPYLSSRADQVYPIRHVGQTKSTLPRRADQIYPLCHSGQTKSPNMSRRAYKVDPISHAGQTKSTLYDTQGRPILPYMTFRADQFYPIPATQKRASLGDKCVNEAKFSMVRNSKGKV